MFIELVTYRGGPDVYLAGWIRLPFWPCVAYMCIGKFLRYAIFLAGLLTVFPAHWVIGN
jgi:membrane protein YqaA with SNARE-associated domain